LNASTTTFFVLFTGVRADEITGALAVLSDDLVGVEIETAEDIFPDSSEATIKEEVGSTTGNVSGTLVDGTTAAISTISTALGTIIASAEGTDSVSEGSASKGSLVSSIY
jgi:hypothetical protein